MIISISGRKGSGKSELAKVCENNGFKVLHFADALKNLVCRLLKCDRKYLEQIKETDVNIKLSVNDMKIISDEIGVSYEAIESTINNRIFYQPRNLLQFIGTDLIRKFNNNWHIDKLKEKIESGINYCIDDVRFANEKKFVEGDLNGICWYIIRTSNFDISNHESEVSLKWNDFDNICINKYKKSTLHKKWNEYLGCLLNPLFRMDTIFNCKDKIELRFFLKNELLIKNSVEIAIENKCSRDKIVWWCSKLMLDVDREKYNFNKESFLYPSELHSYAAGLLSSDGCIKNNKNSKIISFSNTDRELVEIMKFSWGTNKPIYTKIRQPRFKDSYDIDCNNAFIVENIKHWSIKPRKSGNEEIPDIIKNDIDLLKQWIVGIIDGDGSISFSKSGRLTLSILSSLKVLEFINNISPVKANIHKHKRIMYEWRVDNYGLIKFYKWLSPKFGLKRKWGKIDEFLKMNVGSRKYSLEELSEILKVKNKS